MFFYHQLEKFGSRTAVINPDGREVSYTELTSNADELLGCAGEGGLFFLLCSNCEESLTGYVACMRGSAVPAMLSADIDAALLASLLEQYHPAYVWLPAERAEEAGGEQVYSCGRYVLIKTAYSVDYTLNEKLKLLLTTSGSTGSPKFVRQTEDNIQSNTESIAQYLEIKDDDRAITTMPMNYTYGLSIINSHLFCGASVILNEYTLMDKRFWALIRERQATTFGGVPYIYEMLHKLRFGRMELPSLRYLTQAGGKLSPELADEFSALCRDRGMKFIVMYGQTEATARMSWRPWEYAFTKSASMGIAIPGGEFSLIDENGGVITEPNKVGELIYKGRNVTMGYAQCRADLSKGDENHGVLVTGDMAKFDEDGLYYIVGRKKRFLKLFGNRVNLDEVEQLLKSIGIEAVCAGVDDKMKIYITDEAKKQDTISYIDNHTGISHGGYTVLVIDEIPRNASGKIMYSELN